MVPKEGRQPLPPVQNTQGACVFRWDDEAVLVHRIYSYQNDASRRVK